MTYSTLFAYLLSAEKRRQGGLMDNEQKSYMQKLSDKILEWDKKIDELRAEGKNAAADAKEQYKKTADDLAEKKKKAEEKMKELKAVGSESWDDVKRGIDQTIGDLSQAFDRAFSIFKK
jgi:hypothetical protein